jgi:hypothetical protein
MTARSKVKLAGSGEGRLMIRAPGCSRGEALVNAPFQALPVHEVYSCLWDHEDHFELSHKLQILGQAIRVSPLISFQRLTEHQMR